MAGEKKGNGSAFERETRVMLEEFKESIQKLLNNEFKHIAENIADIRIQIKSLSNGVDESKKLYRSVLYGLFGTVIGALIIALLSRL